MRSFVGRKVVSIHVMTYRKFETKAARDAFRDIKAVPADDEIKEDAPCGYTLYRKPKKK